MTNQTNQRKLEHIFAIQQDPVVERLSGHFDKLQLTHRAVPNIARSEVDPSVEFLGKTLSFPFMISSMTGGDNNLLKTVNRNLAIAAEATGVAMAVGSQRVMLEGNSQAEESFMLREYAPNTVLIANLGAVQLNYGFDVKECEKALSILDADGLYLHLNPLQESIQPEGNTNFSNLWDKIATVNQQLSRPLLLKEIGCGMSPQDIENAVKCGIKYVDVAGHGGTSWSRIEHHRRTSAHLKSTEYKSNFEDISPGLIFQDWGISTPQSLIMAAPWRNEITLIASGGIRDGVDMTKSVILGARLCGFAAPLLQPAMESADHVIARINALKETFITAMFLLGVTKTKQLQGNHQLILDVSL